LPRYEAAAFQHLHHAVHRRRGDKKVSLDIRLRGRHPKLLNIPADKAEVLALPLGGFVLSRTVEFSDQTTLTCLDVKYGASDEINTKAPIISNGKVGHFASRELAGKKAVALIDLASHGEQHSYELPGQVLPG
jgi:hypothetical protein